MGGDARITLNPAGVRAAEQYDIDNYSPYEVTDSDFLGLLHDFIHQLDQTREDARLFVSIGLAVHLTEMNKCLITSDSVSSAAQRCIDQQLVIASVTHDENKGEQIGPTSLTGYILRESAYNEALKEGSLKVDFKAIENNPLFGLKLPKIESTDSQESTENTENESDSNVVDIQTPGPIHVQQIQRDNKTIILTAGSVLVQVNEYLHSIEKNNHLCAEHPEHISFVKELQTNLVELIDYTAINNDAKPIQEEPEAKTRWQNITNLISKDIAERTSDEAIAQKALPLGVILGCGLIGALISGPVGFGAGGWVGKLLIGETKVSAVADKIEKALENDSSDQKPEG